MRYMLLEVLEVDEAQVMAGVHTQSHIVGGDGGSGERRNSALGVLGILSDGGR